MGTIHNARILVAGLMVMDVVVKPVDATLFENDTNYVDSIAFLTGGDALNTAINLKKLGMDVAVSGLLGDDVGGRRVLDEFKRLGLDASLVEIREGIDTTVSIVMCQPDGERSFVCCGMSTRLYAAEALTNQALSGFEALYIGSAIGLPGMDGEVLEDLFARAKQLGLITGMDATHSPDAEWLPKIEAALRYTDVFIPSHVEAVRITGETDPARAAAFLRSKGVGIAGVKLGEKGCYIDDGVAPFLMPSIHCAEPIDLTGAGDAFMAGFMFGRLQNWSVRECARFATAVSYSCIQSLGASTHNVTYESACEILRASSI